MEKINHRLSEAEKVADDFKEVKKVVNYLIPAFHRGNDWRDIYIERLSNYRLLNNIINADDVRKHCNPLGIDEDFIYEDEILPYNKIPTKVNLALGEELKRNESFVAAALDHGSSLRKEYQWTKEIEKHIDNEMLKLSIELSMRMGNAEEEEIRQELSKYESTYDLEKLSDYQDEIEVLSNNIIKYAKHALDYKRKKNECFKHVMASDLEAVLVDFIDGKINYIPVNPLHFFYQKSPETEFFEDGDYAGRRYVSTYSQVIQRYNLTDEQIDKLNHSFSKTSKSHLPQKQMVYNYDNDISLYQYYYQDETIDDYIGAHGSGRGSGAFDLNLLWVTHLTWRWERKIGYLTMYNEFNEAEHTFVDESFKIPKEATKEKKLNQWNNENEFYTWYDVNGNKRELQWLWIPRVWEATRINEDLYVNMREVPYQPISITNPFKCKLPYHGTVFSTTNAKSISPVARMKPFQYLYFVVMHQMVKLIGRNYGKMLTIDTSQIDTRLGDGDFQLAQERTLAYLRQGLIIFDSLRDAEHQSDIGLSRPSTSTVDYSNTVDLINLSNVLAWLDVQIGMAFGISPQREAQFTQNSNVSDNQQAIIQSSSITEVYFYKHNEVWKRVLEYFVNSFRMYARDMFTRFPEQENLLLSYVLPNGSNALLSITEDHVQFSDIGVFITNYGNAQEYFDTMRDLSLTFLQNDKANLSDISTIIKSRVNGTSPEEVHRLIMQMQIKQDEKEQKAQEQQSNLLQQQEQMQMRLMTIEHQNELEKIKVEEEERRITEEMKLRNTNINN